MRTVNIDTARMLLDGVSGLDFDVVVRGRSRRVGAQLEWPQSQLMTFRGRKLVAYTVFNTRADALAAIA